MRSELLPLLLLLAACDPPRRLAPAVAMDTTRVGTPAGWATLLPSSDTIQPHPYVTPSRIAGIPVRVRAMLEAHACMVPVAPSGGVSRPQAFHAALYAPGEADDWAVACSRAVGGRRFSTVFVYRAARDFAADSIDEMGEDELQGPSHTAGAAAGYVSSRIYVEEHPRRPLGGELSADDARSVRLTAWEGEQPMHDAVMVDVGAAVMWYWTGRRWIRIPFGD